MKKLEDVPERYVLYAEDDPDDQEALVEMIGAIDPEISVVLCNHGLELMQFLEALPAGAHFPSVAILDMNMPLWDGLHTLEQLKKHSLYKKFLSCFSPLPQASGMPHAAWRSVQKHLSQNL